MEKMEDSEKPTEDKCGNSDSQDENEHPLAHENEGYVDVDLSNEIQEMILQDGFSFCFSSTDLFLSNAFLGDQVDSIPKYV